MPLLYILDDEQVRPAQSATEWADAFATRRQLLSDFVGEVVISTVFVGTNDQLFETKISGGEFEVQTYGTATLAAARAAHAAVLAKVLEAVDEH